MSDLQRKLVLRKTGEYSIGDSIEQKQSNIRQSELVLVYTIVSKYYNFFDQLCRDKNISLTQDTKKVVSYIQQHGKMFKCKFNKHTVPNEARE